VIVQVSDSAEDASDDVGRLGFCVRVARVQVATRTQFQHQVQAVVPVECFHRSDDVRVVEVFEDFHCDAVVLLQTCKRQVRLGRERREKARADAITYFLPLK